MSAQFPASMSSTASASTLDGFHSRADGSQDENDFSRWNSSHRSPIRLSESSSRHASVEYRYIEPVYESFVCPLTKQVMQDPVSIETGQAFERNAIEQWFQECRDNGRVPTCPLTGTQLESLALAPSIALRNAIEEWTARNEAAQIDNARTTLDLNSSEEDIVDALKDIHNLCSKSKINQSRARTSGLISLMAGRLRDGEQIRCAALATLLAVATGDDDNKEAIGNTDIVRSCFKCLSHKLSIEREVAIQLLFELSKHNALCEKIGGVNGSILILVGITSSTSENVLLVQKAEDILANLEKCDQNIKQMAENGRLQPLLQVLVEGSGEERLEMTRYLAEISLSKEGKALVAKTAGKALVEMLDYEGLAGKEAALKCLLQLSTLSENGMVLVRAGALPPVVRDLFSTGSANQLPVRTKEVAASILANIVSSDTLDFRSLSLDSCESSLTSEESIHSLLHLVSNTGPAMEGKLLQVLVGLASAGTVVDNLVGAILSAGATSSLIQFLEAQQKEIRLNSVKLLYLISSHMAQELADGLRGTTGQLGVLVRLMAMSGVKEEQAAAAGLLANLPNYDTSLTYALLKEDALSIVVQRIRELHQGSVPIGGGRYAGNFKAGLVAILSRFTYVLEDPAIINLARENDLTMLFTNLLKSEDMDEIKYHSALALENLSNCSRQLSVIPKIEPPKQFLCFSLSSKKPAIKQCQVHGGVCSARDTFCLIEAEAVIPLASNLDHRNLGVVEASLGALSTLFTGMSDVESVVQILNKAGAVQLILDIMKEHATDALWLQSVSIVEKMLGGCNVAQFLSLDPSVHSGLVEAFRHGNVSIKQAAERGLKQLNKIPNFSAYGR